MDAAKEKAGEMNARLDATAEHYEEEFDEGFAEVADDFGLDGTMRMGLMRAARLMGGAMITILLIAVVLNEVFGAVNVGSGPFSEIGSDLQTTGVAAIGLLVVGLIVVAANRLMSIFGGGGGL